MKQVYIASPLRGDYNTNIQNAVTYCRLASEAGVLPLAPHIIFSQWCNDTIPEQREQGLKLGLSLLEKSDELWVMGTQISQVVQGEIAFAKEHCIPTFYIEKPLYPDTYPISTDAYNLLCAQDCMESADADFTGKLVILRHDQLAQEYRSSSNQLWIAAHGPGCRPGSFTGTVHLCHPVDGDRMTVGRHELCGLADQQVIEKLKAQYPAFEQAMCNNMQDEELCL